ncbi:MAG: zinc ribbon domain-containing protein [Sandaracinaceae bacterium]|nr:zinc ribbon domain-containing protein [Sandaracinaceae bacterium]
MGECSECGRARPAGVVRCVYCGHVDGEEPQCPTCARPLARPGARCVYCGSAAGAPRPRRVESEPPADAPAPRIVPQVIAATPGAGEPRLLETPRARLVAAAGALGLTLAAILSCVHYWPRSAEVDPDVAAALQPHLAEWSEAADTAEVGAPRLRGQLVPIELGYDEAPTEETTHEVLAMVTPVASWRVAALYGLVSSDRVAETPGEVGTVAIVRCETRSIGRYEVGYGTSARDVGSANQWVCQVELVDVIERRRVDRIAFYGTPPPHTTSEGGGTGTRPTVEIAAYLDGLPRVPL